MPLTKFLGTLSGTCRHCGQPAGFLKQVHPGCQKVHTDGWNEMVQLAAQAAGSPTFSETALRRTIQGIAADSHHDGTSILQAIEQGFAQSVTVSQADGIITQQEDETLRAFRDQLALHRDHTADPKALGALDEAVTSRLQRQAQGAGAGTDPNDDQLDELEHAIRSIPASQQKALLVNAWETAVEQALEDGLLSLDEENALSRYARRFNLGQQDLNANGAQTTLVQAAILRDVTQGIIPDRQNIQGHIPFNLMKSEKLVWTFQGVDYLETVVRRERRGSSQGVSIRVAKGLYYSPRQFQSRAVE